MVDVAAILSPPMLFFQIMDDACFEIHRRFKIVGGLMWNVDAGA